MWADDLITSTLLCIGKDLLKLVECASDPRGLVQARASLGSVLTESVAARRPPRMGPPHPKPEQGSLLPL